jgi:hypothetical protein
MLNLKAQSNQQWNKQQLAKFAKKDLPEQLAKALTGVAFEARDAVRKTLPSRFTLRRPWISNSIGAIGAKPNSLTAVVFSRDKFMEAQEIGGINPEARPIPLGRLAVMARTKVIPKSLWVGSLRNNPNVFIRKGIMFEKVNGKSHALYLLKPKGSIKLKQRLGMRETVEQVVSEGLELRLIKTP